MAVVQLMPAEPALPAIWRHAAACRENGAQLTLGIVHEMNNLTGGISVLSEMYLADVESGLPLTEGLELIHKSTARLQGLVRHLQVIHGPINEEPTYFNVAECVRGVFELFAPALPKDITVTNDFPGEELAACLDEAAFRQLLLELTLRLRDAFAAHPAAQRGLRLSLRRLSVTEAELTLALVADFCAESLPDPGPFRVADEMASALGCTLTNKPGAGYVLALPLIG